MLQLCEDFVYHWRCQVPNWITVYKKLSFWAFCGFVCVLCRSPWIYQGWLLETAHEPRKLERGACMYQSCVCDTVFLLMKAVIFCWIDSFCYLTNLQFVLISLSGWGLLFYSGYKLATGGKKETPVESTQWVSLSPGRPFMERPLILMHFVFPFSRLWLVLCFILKIICITFEIWWCLQWINSWQFCVS